ncbi:MAG: D-aminoacylase [Clostridiaceae bacterium]|jgi:N-acyl-D-amino-acid deacylase|nr:D-aminoacylase [Clostridiaceae bacterium]
MLDLKIINGHLIDGSGDKRYKSDTGIKGDKIVAIGDLKDQESVRTIDAEGLVVSPGFIDMHTHSDLSILYDAHNNSKVYDGVTTEVIGNCGIGVAPVNPEYKQHLIDYLGTRIIGSLPVRLELNWGSFKEYLDYVASHAPSVNVVPLVAQGAIRIAEMGFAKGKGIPAQVKHMQKMVSDAMAEGGVGLSSGLVYLPGAYTDTEELTELSKAIRPYGGFYVTHMRNEGDNIFEALEEAINIAKGADVPLHVSHLKLASRKVMGKTEQLFKKIEDAEKEGVEISFDVYPYSCGMTSLGTLMPPWAFEGGVHKLIERLRDKGMRARIKEDCLKGIPGWQNYGKDVDSWDDIMISTVISDSCKYLEGKTIAEIAAEENKEPYEAIFDLLIKENGRIQIVIKMMNDDDVQKIVGHKGAMYGSDGMSLSTEGLLSFGKPHPRAFGTHGIIFRKYVREMGVLTLEDAVKKMTSMPAWRLKLDRRGLIKEGYFADITIFDPDKVQDKGIYKDPKQYTVGINNVIVNGKIVLDDGRHQEVFPGRVIGRK